MAPDAGCRVPLFRQQVCSGIGEDVDANDDQDNRHGAVRVAVDPLTQLCGRQGIGEQDANAGYIRPRHSDYLAFLPSA